MKIKIFRVNQTNSINQRISKTIIQDQWGPMDLY
ncbi:MAG: hypothetical protein Ta2E_00810 [Mycoplasmoidaceae bacterium]|nr:MAG: hypothetical protein Ta2E_00810 [Mycoplasmoidaceae bacterium]